MTSLSDLRKELELVAEDLITVAKGEDGHEIDVSVFAEEIYEVDRQIGDEIIQFVINQMYK